jgi:hypothetical protein
MKDIPAIHLSCSNERAEFWENLRRHAGTGTPVFLSGLEALDPADAARLVHFFLHEPAVTSPVQPLAALLEAMIQKRELSLWDLHPVEAGAEETQSAFLRALPRDQPACLACACFPICQGYGAWAGNCETWLALLTGLAAAARCLSRLRAQCNPIGQPLQQQA